MNKNFYLSAIISGFIIIAAPFAYAQEGSNDGDQLQSTAEIQTSNTQDILIKSTTTFNAEIKNLAEEETVEEVVWDFGDGTLTTGQEVEYTYRRPGSYLVKLRVTTNNANYENSTEIRVFEHLILLVADQSAPKDQLELQQQQAAKEGILLRILQAKTSGPEVLVEEELTLKLQSAKDSIDQTNIIIMWTSGSVGTNSLTRLAQNIRQSNDTSADNLTFKDKGIITLSETPFALLAPTAQSAFDQLQPSYVLLARPQVIDALLTTNDAEQVKTTILSSPLEFRLLGAFSARTSRDIGITNFMSFGVSYLVNRGVPSNSIILILMLPVIATIVAIARQVIGIKSFGLITPALTTLSFFAMGLQYGLIVFAVIVVTGTVTRALLRRLRLLYLPRMALVLTSVSLSLLALLAIGAANDTIAISSFSIFPALILTILAEEYIAAQFKIGVRPALALTGWTLVLATVCYFIVSSEISRTLILAYPEIILLTIPINVALGQWSGLRLTEIFRFRELIRHGNSKSFP